MVKRRSETDRIAELEARIAALKSRIEKRTVTKDPALRHVARAVKSIDIAAGETRDTPLREALENARATLAACLSLAGVLVPKHAEGRARRVVVPSAGAVSSEVLLQYIRSNPGQRGEQISAALGTTSKEIRPVMKQLMEAGHVSSRGERRATSYTAA